MPKDFKPELLQAQDRITRLLESIQRVPLERFTFQAPILDDDNNHLWKQNEVMGHGRFVGAVERQKAVLDTMVETNSFIKEDPLPNVLSVETFWKQCLLAQAPVTAVKMAMKGKGKEEAFVDVIAKGGNEWIKLWTKKDKQLLAEFREQDSYLTSDWEDSEGEDENGGASSSSPKPVNGTNGHAKSPPLTNSLIQMADSLLHVASIATRPPGYWIPQLTIRLTRMEELPPRENDDPRIAQTFQCLRDKGINLVFGDLDDYDLSALEKSSPRPTLLPSLKINLDPTCLVGLCSDIIHHHLPADEAEARKRFLRPSEVEDTEADDNSSLDLAEQSKNSKQLFKEIMEEMEKPLIETIRDTCQAAIDRTGGDAKVEFWATKEAIRHLREAMCSEEIIGEGMEQRRMRRLLGVEEGDFFEGSRYEAHAGCLEGIRVQALPDEISTPMCENGMTSFHSSLAGVADHFAQQYYEAKEGIIDSMELPAFLRLGRLPVPKIVTLSIPFPIVSLHAFARGGAEGMTTLSLGNVLFRELFLCPRWKPKGWCQGSYELEEKMQKGGKEDFNAAVWMLPYRSFAEGKRVRFENGDYSVPQI